MEATSSYFSLHTDKCIEKALKNLCLIPLFSYLYGVNLP